MRLPAVRASALLQVHMRRLDKNFGGWCKFRVQLSDARGCMWTFDGVFGG